MTTNKLTLLQRVTTVLIVLTMMATLAFAYQTAQHTQRTSANALSEHVDELSTRIERKLSVLDRELSRHTHVTDAGSHIFSGEEFNSVSMVDGNGLATVLYGKANYLPVINTAQIIHLNQGEPAIIASSEQATKLFMAKALVGSAGYMIAEINVANMSGQHLSLHAVSNQLVLTDANRDINEGLMQYAVKSSSNDSSKINGYLLSKNTLSLIDAYALEHINVVSVEKSPAFLMLLINNSITSLLTFFGLVLLFCLVYARGVINNKLSISKLQSQTIPLDKRFSSYLNAIANIDKAILSGVNVDDICLIGLKEIQGILQGEFVGLTLLPTKVNKEPTTRVLSKENEALNLKLKIDKALVNNLNAVGSGAQLETNTKDYQMFEGITSKAYSLLIHPVYNEGVLFGFIFTASKDAPISDTKAECLKNIAQHLGIAFTTIASNEQLYIKQYFDPVTELYNQQACRERLTQEFSGARRRKEKVAVFHIKLLGYKKVNETFGYSIGDQLLKEAGKRLKDQLRDSDIVARLGSDDFIVATSDIELITNANRLADKLAGLFVEPIQIFDNTFNLSTAIGISLFPTDGMTVDEVLNNANAAMNKAKASGDGQYAFYEENLSTNEAWRINLDKELRNSLEGDGLFMLYQAQTNPRNKKVVGVEALLRWRHPTRGIINPTEFIQLAEETGLIVNLGQFARETAFKQYMAWKKDNCAPERISVNVSSYEMQRKQFVAEVKANIDETGIDPKAIELEITETLLLEVSGNVISNLKALSEMGITIAIDDFGTGYSNLSYLGRLPFDVLKIDKSFMHGIGLQSSANQVVTMMIEMAHHLGKSVCAEGVENDVQFNFLEKSGCDVIQGYLISKPVSGSDFATLVINTQSKSESEPELQVA